MKIEEMIHCCHTLKCLHAAGIETIEQLTALSAEDLLEIRGIGKVIAADLTEMIHKYRLECLTMKRNGG